MNEARRLRDRVDALACVLTAEVTESQASLASAGTPVTSLLAATEGRDAREAAGQVFLASEVSRHAAARDAALEGLISTRHAAAIAKGMAQLPAELPTAAKQRAEEIFVEKADGVTPQKLAALAPLVLAEVAPELVPSPEDRAASLAAQRERAIRKRSFKWGDDGDGSVWFRGSLPELEAAPLVRMVEAYVESDRRAARRRQDGVRSVRPGPQAIRDARVADLDRTPEQRQADALVELVESHRGAPSTVGDRPRVVVTISESSLRDRVEAAGVLPSGAEVPAGALRRLACDADVLPVVLGSESEVLDVGRAQRLVTPGIRRTLSLRDGGCVFPGCDKPDASCEAHHVRPWWAGGVTSLDNLALLCPHHHKLVEPDRYETGRDRWRLYIDEVTRKPVVVPPRRFTELTGSGSVSGGRGSPMGGSPGGVAAGHGERPEQQGLCGPVPRPSRPAGQGPPPRRPQSPPPDTGPSEAAPLLPPPEPPAEHQY
ncbi:MAG TPA: HNH endonuclease [Tessaracoccus flavescens]|uniref:HNH endonuclease n=1 Tax=Tessaracoccus flavescens TaxID=399497 RepID=A0A921EP57_9ACTN|nr:HNH endonuclease [Tessaracoccus flavescens]